LATELIFKTLLTNLEPPDVNKEAAGLDSMCCLMGNPTDGYTPKNQLPTVGLIKPSTWSQDSPLRSDRKRRLSIVNGDNYPPSGDRHTL